MQSILFSCIALGQQPPMDAPPKRSGDWRKAPAVGPLQAQIEQLTPASTLRLARGVHVGPIVIRQAGVTILGEDGARISGQGSGSVVVVEASNVSIKNVSIEASGMSHDQVDAGISIREAHNVVVDQVSIRDCLFGVDIESSNSVSVKNSQINSKNLALGLRGDAIRVFDSRAIEISGNEWHHTRDAVVWYTDHVKFERNKSSESRYSIHSMYSKNLFIQENKFDHNAVGIFIMYGESTTIRRNVVSRSTGPTGLCLGMKETSALYAESNSFLSCANGILVDNSPLSPTLRNWFFKNTIAFNGTGILFSNAKEGNVFQYNTFQGNLTDVDTESRRTSRSDWRDNFWDNYQGFDRDRNDIGDSPHRIYKYPNLLASNHPAAGFFNHSPITLLILLVERLLPVTNPMLVVEDVSPHLVGGNSL